MRPQRWRHLVELSPEETAILRRIHRAKVFVFLREQRHQLFTPDFQEELARTLYADNPKGHPPIPQPNWRWRRFCKPIPGSLTTR